MNKKTILAYDFAGVLDIKNSYLVNNRNITFKTREQTDVRKAIMLFKFALETNSYIVSISTLAKYVSMNRCLFAAIIHSEDESLRDDIDFISANKMNLKKLFKSTPSFTNKQDIINKLNESEYNIIAFEDEYQLNDCNMIWVSNKLNEEHIEKARTFIKC